MNDSQGHTVIKESKSFSKITFGHPVFGDSPQHIEGKENLVIAFVEVLAEDLCWPDNY